MARSRHRRKGMDSLPQYSKYYTESPRPRLARERQGLFTQSHSFRTGIPDGAIGNSVATEPGWKKGHKGGMGDCTNTQPAHLVLGDSGHWKRSHKQPVADVRTYFCSGSEHFGTGRDQCFFLPFLRVLRDGTSQVTWVNNVISLGEKN